MKSHKILFTIFLILTVAINVFIIVEGFIGGDGSASQSFSFTEMFIEIVKAIDPESEIVKNPEATHAVIRKLVGHFALFGLSGIFTVLTFVFTEEGLTTRKIETIYVSLTLGFSVALTSELAQLVTPGRFMSFGDVGIDFAGFLTFGGLTYLISYLIKNRKKKE